MERFRYQAIDRSGVLVTGIIEASDRPLAASMLQSKGLVLLKVDHIRSKNRFQIFLNSEIGASKQIKSVIAARFIERLSLLLTAGITLEHSLQLLSHFENESLDRNLAASLLEKLRTGARFADAMELESPSFDVAIIAITRAGEMGGTLGPTLQQLAVRLQRTEEVKSKLRSALIYPATLIATAVAAIVLIMSLVVPQLEPLILSSDIQPSPFVRAIFSSSHLLIDYWWMLLLAGASFLTLIGFALRQASFRRAFDKAILNVPIIGPLMVSIESARFARALAALLAGGIRLQSALKLCRPIIVNQALVASIDSVVNAVSQGGSLTSAISRAALFPGMLSEMVRIGEATGQLAIILVQAADILEREVQRILDRFVALLVPTLTFLIGGFVATLIVSVMVIVTSINDVIR